MRHVEPTVRPTTSVPFFVFGTTRQTELRVRKSRSIQYVLCIQYNVHSHLTCCGQDNPCLLRRTQRCDSAAYVCASECSDVTMPPADRLRVASNLLHASSHSDHLLAQLSPAAATRNTRSLSRGCRDSHLLSGTLNSVGLGRWRQGNNEIKLKSSKMGGSSKLTH